MKNDVKGLTRFDDLPGVDPAVESLLGQGQRRQDEARLPRAERSRKKKERERAQKRKPNRFSIADLVAGRDLLHRAPIATGGCCETG